MTPEAKLNIHIHTMAKKIKTLEGDGMGSHYHLLRLGDLLNYFFKLIDIRDSITEAPDESV